MIIVKYYPYEPTREEIKQLQNIDGVKMDLDIDTIFTTNEHMEQIKNILPNCEFRFSDLKTLIYNIYDDGSEYIVDFGRGKFNPTIDVCECIELLLQDGTELIEESILNCEDHSIYQLIYNMIKIKLQFVVERYIYKLQAIQKKVCDGKFEWN